VPQMDQILSRTRAFQALILARRLGHLARSPDGFFVTCTAMCLTLAVALCSSDLKRPVALPPAAAR
jgi:hypothetical protein